MPWDTLLRANIDNVMKLCREKDWDWLSVYDGPERVGKSEFAKHVMFMSDPALVRNIECAEYDVVLGHIAWTFDGMLELVKTMPVQEAPSLLYDEASILGREAMKEWNLRFIRVMTTIGFENRFFGLTFPNFWMLDPYLRDSRCRTRFYVTSTQGIRGYASVYVQQRYPFPRPGGETVWWKYAFTVHWPPIKSLGTNFAEFNAKYREKDSAVKRAILEGPNTDPVRDITRRLREKGLTIQEIADIVGKSHGWVGGVVKPKYKPTVHRRDRKKESN